MAHTSNSRSYTACYRVCHGGVANIQFIRSAAGLLVLPELLCTNVVMWAQWGPEGVIDKYRTPGLIGPFSSINYTKPETMLPCSTIGHFLKKVGQLKLIFF